MLYKNDLQFSFSFVFVFFFQNVSYNFFSLFLLKGGKRGGNDEEIEIEFGLLMSN